MLLKSFNEIAGTGGVKSAVRPEKRAKQSFIAVNKKNKDSDHMAFV